MMPEIESYPWSDEPLSQWQWRNCRSAAITFQIWICPWALKFYREDDCFGGERGLHIGPLTVGIAYNVGPARKGEVMREAIAIGIGSFAWFIFAQFEPTPVEHSIDIGVSGVTGMIAWAVYYILHEIRKGRE